MLSTEEAENAPVTLISEWSITCRTCLRSGETRSLFETMPGTALSFAEKVMHCTNVIIREGDNLPDRICVECIEELEVAYQFRKNCEGSNAMLQSYLAGTNDKQVESDMESVDPSQEEIAIPLDSGVLYTYKPPSGLNVKLVQCREVSGPLSPECVEEEEAEALDNETTVEHSVVVDDNGLPVTVKASEGDDSEDQSVRIEGLDSEAYLDERIVDTGYEIMEAEEDNLMKSSETEDCYNASEDATEYLTLAVGKTVRTIQTIRKTNTPNEVKPTIETVTTQPATDGSGGTETVIRVKRNISTEKQTFLCEICNTTYRHKNALETHLRRHRGDLRYKCEFCDKAFVVPFELQRHIRTHTGQKPYKCQYCDRMYSDFGSKTKHERTHTGERPYSCIYCNKAFSYSHVLNSHLLTHTGEKKYSCLTCGKRFTKSHHLKGHQKTHQTVSSAKGRGDAKEPNRKESTLCTLELTNMLANGDSMDAKEAISTSTGPLMLDHHQPDHKLDVVSYGPTSRLATSGWTIEDVTLPFPDAATDASGTDGVQTLAESSGSVVTIGAEELGSVSIVSFNDYMMKPDAIAQLMMNVGEESCPDNVTTVDHQHHQHGEVDTLQDYVTVLLPKADASSALVDTGFGTLELIDS